jgi:predicted membrane protein (TIGR00267 family)
MRLFTQTRFLLSITHSQDIMRRYFIVNGFDGALTMLGLMMGFLLSTPADLSVIINACLGAGIALGMSGLSSAYISESAERTRALGKLEEAMATDLQNSAHGEAVRVVPWVVALVNGLAPLIISLLILLPLLLADAGVQLPLPALYAAVMVALILVFLLGIFLGRIADTSWLRSGFQALFTAVVTAGLIVIFTG